MYRVSQRVATAVAGVALTEVWFAFPALQAQRKKLLGQRIVAVETLGKALLIRFENGYTLYTHNQLYGRWMFSRPDQRPNTRRQLRLALSSPTRSALLYSASSIELITPGTLQEHPFIKRAGLDVLSSRADVAEIVAWIAQPRFARRRLGLLLLDQSFLAGIGNYLRSEILFDAGLDPDQRPADLDQQAMLALAVAAHRLLWRSVETAGITNDPAHAATLRAAGWRRRDYRHFVFGRQAQACFRCDQPIERIEVGSRRLYRCPGCQSR